MRKQFFCNACRALYEDYYTRQSGGEVPVFYGARTQRGHGLGSILGGLFRRALPFLSSGAKILGQQAMNVASDLIDGKSFQDSTKIRLKEGIKTFVTSNPIIPQSGSGVRRKLRVSRRGSRVKRQKRGRLQIFCITWHSYTTKAANAPRPSWTYFRYRLHKLVSSTETMSSIIH